jgi:hypothetical protein
MDENFSLRDPYTRLQVSRMIRLFLFGNAIFSDNIARDVTGCPPVE